MQNGGGGGGVGGGDEGSGSDGNGPKTVSPPWLNKSNGHVLVTRSKECVGDVSPCTLDSLKNVIVYCDNQELNARNDYRDNLSVNL